MNEGIELRVVEKKTNDENVIYLFKRLRYSIKIIEPITYVTPNDDEDAGE
jgi:hypothetical protein